MMQAPTKPPAKVATCRGSFFTKTRCEGEIWGYEMCWDHWEELWKRPARMQ